MSAPNRVVEGFTHVVGSSELGSCLKAQTARFLGYDALPTPPRTAELYQRGHDHEAECLAAMDRDNWWITGHQDEAVIDCGDSWCVVIHYDGLGAHAEITGSRARVVEIKSPSTWASFERAVRTNDFSDAYMNRIAYQVSAQMVASGLEAVVACVEEGRVKTFGIEMPIYDAAAIQGRVNVLRAFVNAGSVPVACTSADWPCAYLYLHGDERTEIDDPALIEVATEYARLGEVSSAADAERKALRAPLDALAVGRYAVGPTYVTVATTKGRKSLNETAMIADGIDVEKYRQLSAPGTLLRVTPRGQE